MPGAPLLVLAALSAVCPAAADDSTLQSFLARLLERRAEEQRRLEPPVHALVQRLEELGSGWNKAELTRIHQELDALGPEAALLLLPYVDPGAAPSDAQAFRAAEVASALQRRPLLALTEPLLRLSREAGPAGRLNAVRLLGVAPDAERASARLREIFREGQGPLRLEAVAALARLGGEENLALLSTALGDPDASVQAEILRALAAAGSQSAAPAVLEFARDPARAKRAVMPLLHYLERCPEVLDAEFVRALAALAASDAVDVESRVALLDSLRKHLPLVDEEARRTLDELRDAPQGTVREAAQVVLALLGDRPARRALLDYYDELVAKNERFAPAYEQRARMTLRLGDYADAAKDYRRAIEILQKENRYVDREIYIELARAFVLDEKLRQAAETLEEARLAEAFLRRLEQDPDFQALREHSRYGRMFDGLRQ
jgi:HEAT repeat protein